MMATLDYVPTMSVYIEMMYTFSLDNIDLQTYLDVEMDALGTSTMLKGSSTCPDP